MILVLVGVGILLPVDKAGLGTEHEEGELLLPCDVGVGPGRFFGRPSYAGAIFGVAAVDHEVVVATGEGELSAMREIEIEVALPAILLIVFGAVIDIAMNVGEARQGQ